MKKPKVRILLADDHKMLRDGLRLLIDAHPEMSVVGEAANGHEALEQVRRLHPQVVVMDLSMPQLSGLQATERLRNEFPDIKIVALTAHEDESYLSQLCKAGASGYVLKRSAGDDLLKAILTVSAGGIHFEASLASKLLAREAGVAHPQAEAHSAALSVREKEVLLLLAWGYSNKEIAHNLRLSVKTVETYKVRVAEKLGLRSRTEMVQFALRQGWLNETQAPK